VSNRAGAGAAGPPDPRCPFFLRFNIGIGRMRAERLRSGAPAITTGGCPISYRRCSRLGPWQQVNPSLTLPSVGREPAPSLNLGKSRDRDAQPRQPGTEQGVLLQLRGMGPLLSRCVLMAAGAIYRIVAQMFLNRALAGG